MTAWALGLSGAFAIGLGAVHTVIPRLFDLAGAIGHDGDGRQPLSQLRLGPLRYQPRRSDAAGLTWVMSNAASYVLVTVGFVDLLAMPWLTSPGGRIGAAWIGGWWLLRAVGQFVIGRRRVDLGFAAVFGLLAAVHGAVALAILPAVAG